jgi:phage terminase Nu1 subunit (DNA packaging protein)
MAEIRVLATREVEPYVTRAELASLMGVSVRTVDRLVCDGMPSVCWGRRTRRFKASIALQWAKSRDAVGAQGENPAKSSEGNP